MLPSVAALTNLALLALGAVVGALVFSFVIGRYRSRQIAHLADLLAHSAGTPDINAVHVADPVLEDALQRLMSRISDVEAMASTDQLTRLLNRPACLGVLGVEIDRANRYERPLTVALIDIDRFKRINDTYGHAVGDELLRHVAQLLRSNVRNVDALGRYGGEEFLLVMPETDLDGGLASAETLRRVVGRSPLEVETPTGRVEISVTISVGVAGHLGVRSLDATGCCAKPTSRCTKPKSMAATRSRRIGRSASSAASRGRPSTLAPAPRRRRSVARRSPRRASICSRRCRSGPAGPVARRS